MNTILKRVISLLLCFVLAASCLPVSAFAAENGEATATEATQPSIGATEPSSAPTESEVIAVTGITLDQTALEVGMGAVDLALTATVLPENATDKTVTWTSSEPGVASVDGSGALTIGYMGEAVITATAGEFSASCTVTVGEGEWNGYSNDEIDYLFVATDRHTNTSVIGNIINNIESYIGENELDYLALGGDMVGSGNSHPKYNSSTVLGEVTGATSSLDSSNVDIVAGIHDMNVNDDAGIVLPYSGGGAQIFEGDRFYVYGVEEYCISEDSNSSNWSSEAQKFVTWANGSDIDKSKVIIVVSHYPLHAKRDDNDGAYYWHQALNTVATGVASGDSTVERDIVFFHGHNHTKDSNEYVYNVGDTMSIQNGGTTASDTIYYTYATAGYLNQNSKATLVIITDDTVSLTKYTTSGSGNAMSSVTRVAEPVTLTSISVSGTTEYTVGDELELTVTAAYSDGITVDVTADATLSGYDMNTAGTYTVTAAYEGKTATIEITVSEAETSEPTVNTVECWDDTEQVTVEVTGLGLTEVAATNMYGTNDAFDDVFTDHMAVDVALTGLVEGASVKYSISVVPDLDITNLELYYVEEDGTLTPVEFTLVTDELNNVYVEFTTDKVGTFVYGSPNVPEGYTLTSLTLANIPTDVFLGTTLYLDETAEVTATYTKEGAEDFVRKLTIYDYDYTNFSGFDVNVSGKQTVTFTFEGVSVTHDIYVWGESFTDENTGVSVTVGEGEYGVTAATVTESANINVADAVLGFLETGTYVAYDITLNFTEGYATNDAPKTVTLPLPEGLTNPVVYYVSDNGQYINDMGATVSEDGKFVIFTTTHFSTYVLGDGTTIETESSGANVESSTVTTTKDVWVKVDAPVNGGEYLIVSTGTAGTSGYVMGNSTAVTPVSGILTVDGTDGTYTYIDTDGTIWTASGSNSSLNFQNENGTYLGYTTSSSYGGTSYSLSMTASNATAWTWSNNNLYFTTTSTIFGGTTTYYRYISGGSSWSLNYQRNTAPSNANIYFYQKVTASETIGTEGGTYTVEGTDILDAVAIKDTTVDLSSKLYWQAESSDSAFEVTDHGLTPTYEVVTTKGNPNVIAKNEDGTYKIDGSNATLSGTVGTAVIKVTYTSGDLVAWDEFIVTATAIPDDQYTITMHKQTTDAEGNPAAGDEITAPITIKNIMNGMQDSVWAVVKANGIDLGALGDKLYWSISGDPIGTINSETGVITFNGTEGIATITASYTCPGGRVIQASVTYSVTVGNYTVPEDGTDDFPEYPEPGAIRFDKHATAVGNFSETGITQVELSMTGVPYGTDQAIDVVVMLDMTGSMSDDGMEAAELATIAFVEKIVVDGKDADGNKIYNKNRVAVYAFNSGSSSPYELVSLGTIDSDSELETANTAIKTASTKQTSGGTPFDEAAQKCHDVLAAAKKDGIGNDRKQFCVFMSDGGPTTYEGSDGYTYYGGNASGDRKITSYIGGYSSSSASSWTYNLPTEYWTDDMKADGVTVYTVGLLLQNKPSNPSPYSSMTSSTYDSTTDSLTTIGSHYYFTSTILKNMASDTNKYIDIFNVDNASKATAAFEAIAQSILDAATDVKVTDKIASDYTMVFEAPNTVVSEALPNGQEMYIEIKDYVLNPVYGTDGTTIVDYTRGTAASLMKLYLGKNGTTYYAASDANGTAYATPTFNQTAIGTMYYWTTNQTTSGVSVTVDNTTYYFDEAGMSKDDEDYVAANWFNMASGAYASGNITTTNIVADDTNQVTGTNSVCNDLIIATPYFVYNAATKILTWTTAKLSTSELTLSYFLYLDESGGYSGADNETPAGTYETNEYAHLSYTNFQGTDCQQTFPVPQMTWNGAQVSYVFYLVNDQGQPVNRAGKVVPFSEAVYVTDTYNYAIVWNDEEEVASLEAEYLAKDLVPEVYELFDQGATYDIHVFEDEEGQNLNNHFIIGSSSSTYTTYVFNTKADTTKYKNPATYAATSSYKCKEYVENGQYTDDKGSYNIVTKTGATIVETGFDFSNTTVAFAVTWTPGLAEDAVVVDYGLDVVIDVIKNDNMAAGVVGVRTTAPSDVTTDGTYDRVEADTLTSVDLYIDANNDEGTLKELKIGTATIENMNSVRFSLDETNGMQFTDPAVFYYEADVNFYDTNNELQTTSMYSKVTVIPATTIYYEDDFLALASFSKQTDGTWAEDENSAWAAEGTKVNATQDQDRPGESKISEALDADNVYGYDAAYETMSTHSLGNAAMVHVDSNSYATAEFTFYGTGFDVISMTSNTTGTIVVDVYQGAQVSDNVYKTTMVDTYYGMDADGNISVNSPEEIYQVPVIKIFDMPYGQYTVVITATYAKFLDHTTDDGYDLYLDAIRIYDPAGTTYDETDENGNVTTDGNIEDVIQDAYIEDGEAWPKYTELRNNIIAASQYQVTNNEDGTVTVTGDAINGVVFIDCNEGTSNIADYVSYGPNNELYLKNGQAIAFNVNVPENVADIQLGIKVANGNSVTYSINGDQKSVNTTTDMYYSILNYAKSGTVTITNTSGGILSLTNIKVTHTSAPAAESGISLLSMDAESAGVALMMLRRAPVIEEEIPETTVPETTVPEETEPETEATEPETEPVKPDNSDLKAAVDDAKKLKEKDYTKESYAAVKAARKAAEKVLKDKKATQAEIDKALEALNEAVEALETKAPSTKPGKNEKPNKADKENQNKSNSNNNNSTVEQQVGQIIVQIANALFGWLFN